MLTLRQGSQARRLIGILSITGEFPVRSLHLLGKERVLRDLVRRMSVVQLVRNPDTGAQTETRLLRLNGSGREKSIRLCKGALPILDWLDPDAYRYYMASFWGHHFPGDAAHRDRNHRVAETAAFCAGTGLEVFPYRLPPLQMERLCRAVPEEPSFYFARDLKKIHASEQNKTSFTRMVGAVFYPGGCYAVYNTRSAAMKWNGMGEFKAKHSLTEIARMNADVQEIDAALLLGGSWETALETLRETRENHRLAFRFDGIYRHVYFLPLNGFGMRRLRLLTLPDWRERLLSLVFEPENRSYDRGSMEYDACVDGVSVYSHLDGDLARLIRFREAAETHSGKLEVLCFPEEAQLLHAYLGREISIKTIPMDVIEEALALPKEVWI